MPATSKWKKGAKPSKLEPRSVSPIHDWHLKRANIMLQCDIRGTGPVEKTRPCPMRDISSHPIGSELTATRPNTIYTGDPTAPPGPDPFRVWDGGA